MSRANQDTNNILIWDVFFSAVAFVLPMLVSLASFSVYQALGNQLAQPVQSLIDLHQRTQMNPKSKKQQQ